MEMPMKIIINEQELKDVITDYLKEQMPERANESFEVRLVAGRGDNGHYAEIEIEKRKNKEAETPAEEEQVEAAAEDEAAVDPFGLD
jgi:hypothetical protein